MFCCEPRSERGNRPKWSFCPEPGLYKALGTIIHPVEEVAQLVGGEAALSQAATFAQQFSQRGIAIVTSSASVSNASEAALVTIQQIMFLTASTNLPKTSQTVATFFNK